MTYSEYKSLLDSLMAKNMTTGTDQSEMMVNYARLNLQRMKRVEKTFKIIESLSKKLEVCSPQKWLILTEGWCGDAAQIVPALEKIVLASNGKIESRYLLRDENIELMDLFLTNGGRAIPKVIILSTENEIINNWGPRPESAQNLVNQLKSSNTAFEELAEQLHAWYAKDKTISTQVEWEAII